MITTGKRIAEKGVTYMVKKQKKEKTGALIF
jgi:hypothetical protein